MLVYIYTLLISLYIVSQFAFEDVLNYIIGVFAIIALVYSFFNAKGSYLISGIIFLISGIGLFLYNQLPWYSFLLHFKPMLGLLSLFLVLPFITSLLRVGHYDKNLSRLLHDRINNLGQLYRRSFFVCFILGLFLNIATLPLLMNALNHKLRHLPPTTMNKFFTRNLLRGFFLCLTWSPMEIMVIMSLELTKTKYYSVLPFIVFMVIIAVILDLFISNRKFKHISFSDEPLIKVKHQNIYKKIGQLSLMLLLLIVAISLTEALLGKGYLMSVVLVLIPFSILWTVFIGKPKRYLRISIPFWMEKTKGLGNYFFMFLSAGLFIEMVSASGVLNKLQPIFVQASENILFFYLIIGIYFIVFSCIGFHPIISFTFLAGLLKPILPNLHPIPLAIVLISASLTPTMYGPYNLSISILSDQLKVNPYRIALWNLPFVIFYVLISIIVAYLLGLLLF